MGRGTVYIPIELQNKAIEKLKEGKSAYKVAKETNLSSSYVNTLAKRNNIKLQDILSRRIVNNNPFSKLNDESWYWIGFLAADGAVKGTKIALTLSKKDYNHILKYRDYINKKLKIRESIHHGKYTHYGVSFRNTDVVQFLKNIGVTERKTLTLNILELNWSFLRGYIDGDGYISSKRKEISFLSASNIFTKQISNFLDSNNIIHSVRKINRKNTIYNIRISRKSLNCFIDYLYNKAHVYLERKHNEAVLIRNS